MAGLAEGLAMSGVFGAGQFLGCEGGGRVIKVYEGVKDSVGKDTMFIVQVISGCVLNVDMESFNGV
jgi:hypothetical protein